MTTVDRPAARWELPIELIERERASTLRLRLHRDGSPVIPASVTIEVRDTADAALTGLGTPSETSDGWQAVVGSSVTEELPIGSGYRVVWVATMDDGSEYVYDRPAAMCRRILYPTVSDIDIRRRWPHLDPTRSGSMVSRTASWQGELDHAWWTIQRRLIDMGRRPWMILGPSALHEPHELLTGAIIHEGLAARGNPTMREMGEQLRRDYDRAFSRVTFDYDEDEDGRDDSPDSRMSAVTSLWLGGAPPETVRWRR